MNEDTYALFIGRWQPFHAGHRTLIDVALNEGRIVVIGVRDTWVDDNNPYTANERVAQIKKVYPQAEVYPSEKATNVLILKMPDITEVCHGRKVGWTVREIKLDEKTEKISATNIRKELRK